MGKNAGFRFGIVGSTDPSGDSWLDYARRAEDLGYATFLVDDHLDRTVSPFAALGAVAAATRSLRFGTLVLGNDFRHPVAVAKEAATLDVLSGGRLELGLGTGYAAEDYRRTGIPIDPPSVRVSRFEEALQIIKGAFAHDPFTFSGDYYQIAELSLLPKPVQKLHPPIVVGGGSRRMLSLAGREADIVSINIRTTPEGGFDFTSMTPAATAQKVEWVRQAAGARFDELELNMLGIPVAVTDDRQGMAAEITAAWGFAEAGVSPEDLLAWPATLIGSVNELVEKLESVRERYGISYVALIGAHQIEAFAPVVAQLAGR